MSQTSLVADFQINNPNGLHARPGAYLVAALKPFTSEVKITNTDRPGKTVSARSLLNLMVLGIKRGHHVRIFIDGDDAQQTLAALQDAIASGLGEALTNE